jgi:hypothetical protein
MKKFTKYIFLILMAGLPVFQSCTNLDEVLYDQVPVDEYGTTEDQLNSLVGPVYVSLRSVFPGDYFQMVEQASDMAITPTRFGGDWWDGGQFKALRMHSWTSQTSIIEYAYNTIMANISQCNQIYSVINTSNASNKEKILAEIRGVRAYWYYLLIDCFGNVPIVTDFSDMSKPATKTRAEVFEFIINELNDIKDVVRVDVSSASYSKITKGVVFTLLAKMYLNAMVWNPAGGEKWQECIDACDTVMSLGYIIEPNWKTNFQVQNEVSKEAIFSEVFSRNDDWNTGGNYLAMLTLHYLDPIALGLRCAPWNGISGMPDYVSAYDPEDIRLKGSFLTGAMKDPATGDTLMTAQNRPLIHTVDITMKYSFDADGWGQTEQEDGARCCKWDFEAGLPFMSENDFHIFRLADVYLMKAEAILRNGGSNGDATNLVNIIRLRAFGDNAGKLLSSVTLDDVYKERRFELAWECVTRQDQIRFGTFLNAIPVWKPYVSDDKYLLFPIPLSALNANDKLVQNPGY